MTATCVLDIRNTLGESCFQDPRDGRLWWTDIEGACVYRLDADSEATRFALPGRAGFILPRREPGFVIGFKHQIAVTDAELRVFTRIVDVEVEPAATRVNDAAVDPFGGIVFGTFDETPDPAERRPIAAVYRLAPDGTLSRLFDGVTVSNGLAFSPEGDVMYFADTRDGTIRRFHVEQGFASWHEIEPLAGPDVAPGRPDGAEVDSAGNYWSARVHGGCAVRLSPDGRVTARVDLPVDRPTCVALGGPDLSTLFVTSLRGTRSAEDLARTPLAGGLFAAPVDVPGRPQRLASL
ncbi:MAG: SMP-30/gluconolactonase/LRE family protein [Azospirillaceae bacterium]